MGEVYRARDTRLARDVALKVRPAGVASDPDRLARFRREAHLLAALNHAHIAQVHGFGAPALVMELVDGPTLADRLSSGPIAIDEARVIGRQIAEALEAAHEKGIVHRDLQPANIKVADDGTDAGGWGSNWTTTADFTKLIVVEAPYATHQRFRLLTDWRADR